MSNEDHPEEEIEPQQPEPREEHAAERHPVPAEYSELEAPYSEFQPEEGAANSGEFPESPEPAEPGDEPEEEPTGDSAKPEAQLQALMDAAKTGRLSPADEERAVQLLKQTIPGGPKALPATLDALLTLQWSAGVKAVTEAWPETKPAGRTRLLTGLAKQDGDVSRRIRLSLARGLHGQDPASAVKLIAGVCEAMGGADGGSTTKDRQIFANVMLGKAQPWLMNVPMAEMKPAEALKLIIPALESCHQAPIFTQIWVLRWIIEAEKFDSLSTEHIASIGKVIARWQPRWRKELRKIIPKFPESLEAAIGEDRPAPAPAPAPARGETEPAESESPSAEAEPRDERDEEELEDEEAEEDEEEDEEEEEEEPAASPVERRSPRQPQQQPPQQQRGGGGRERDRDRERGGDRERSFDLTRSLREIDSYVSRLRTELQQAQAAARRKEPPPRGRQSQQPALSSEETEELRRHNIQLEEQNHELRTRIDELLNDHEDRAATLGMGDSLEQFKTFLGLKLKDDFADYNAISREALNEVVRRHAHEILGRIFSVLQSEGVRFDREE